jgi:ATP-dependent exoDNAse (exonuclease V) beta subunit
METKMTADESCRAQALDTSRSFIVQAPAGSGKTELLIRRYLALLARVNEPESIVAITFTRKAAAEMASRVLKTLRDAAENTPVSSSHEQRTRELAVEALRRGRALGWRLHDNPARLQIQTIDSLCARIASAMPWVARLGALPGFTEQPEPLYREAARETLRLLESDPEVGGAVATLLMHCDNRASLVIDLVAGMLGRRDQWLEWTEKARRDPAETRAEFERRLRQVSTNCLNRLDQQFPHECRADTMDLARSAAAQLGGSPDLAAFPGVEVESVPVWKELAALLLKKDGGWRQNPPRGWRPNPREKMVWSRVLGQLGRLGELAGTFDDLLRLPPTAFTDEQWEVMTAAFDVLRIAVAQLKILFRKQGQIDFNELNSSAALALGSFDQPTDLGLVLGEKIEHLLLDEFQDTSRAQFDLILRVTSGWYTGDGRTLFLVGDPMQSIYRFRQAEVGLFEEARQHGIGGVELVPLSLSANFRSGEGVVSWVNRIFDRLMPASSNPNSGDVPFSASEATRDEIQAIVSVHGFVEDESGDEQAIRALDIIRGVPADRTIGVLARTRNNLTAIVRHLRRNSIPFQAVELDSLARRPVIEDLLSLTFALLHPAARIAWLSILRAPWCGLSLVDLEAIAGADKISPVWELALKNLNLLSSGGQVRLRRIAPVIHQALAERGKRPLRSLVEDAWRALGGPQCAGGDADLDDAEAFLGLLEQLETGGDLGDFELLRDCTKSLFAEPDPRAGEHVQLMTIHKAKGLEFDVVILPELHRSGKSGSRMLLAWMDNGDGILAAPVPPAGVDDEPIYDYVNSSERRKEQSELNRLLYVAATRARRELHLLGSASRKIDGSLGQPKRDTFLGMLWPDIGAEFAASLTTAAAAGGPRAGGSARVLRRFPENWVTPPFAAPVEWTQTVASPPSAAEQISYEWVGNTLRYVGTVLHAFLERIAREGVAQWEGVPLSRYRSAFRAALSNEGVPEEEMDSAIARVEKAISQCLADSRGRWIFDAHSEAQNELAISGVAGGQVVEARIDRTFVDERGVRWIIDYKSTSHRGGGTEAFLEEQLQRHTAQLNRYAAIFALREERPIKLGLYFPLLNEWREWDAPRPERRAAVQASLFD